MAMYRSKAPKPFRTVRSGKLILPLPGMGPFLEVPPPPYRYPPTLYTVTREVLLDASYTFRERRQIIDFCKKVISDLTGPILEQIASGLVPQDVALSQVRELIRRYIDLNTTESTNPSRSAVTQAVETSEEYQRLYSHVLTHTDAKSIGQQIDNYRIEHGWTIEELAEKTHQNPRTVARHIKGERPMHRKTKEEYERAFGKTLKNPA